MAGPPPRSIDAGIFNVARPSYSASTLQLVKLLMEETRVPKQQQRLFEQSLRSGQPLPAPARRGPMRGGRRPVAVSVCKTDNGGGRRTRDTITRLENEHGSPLAYRPRPGRDRDAERERLAYVMTHGRQQPGEDGPPSEEPERTPPQEDRFEELWQEVEERRQFLAEMRQLGRGEQYEPIIRGEVARLVQEMEELQKQEADGGGQRSRGSGNE